MDGKIPLTRITLYYCYARSHLNTIDDETGWIFVTCFLRYAVFCATMYNLKSKHRS